MAHGDDERSVLERYCEAWRGGDLEALIDCYDQGFTLHYFGQSRYAGEHRGKASALAVLAEVSGVATRELVAVDEVMVGDGCGAIVVRERLTRDGEVHELRRVLRYTIGAGRLQECWLYDEDQRLVDHLWR